MRNAKIQFSTATRQAALIACAVAGLATAAAAQTTYKLKVGADGGESYRGTAQVTSAPSGIDCLAELVGDVGPTGACTASFSAGAVVTLTATPLFDGTFDGWSGACAGQGQVCQVEMTMDLETSARTIAKTYTLTVVGTGNAFGQVHSNNLFAHPYIACNIVGTRAVGACVGEVPAGKMVWLGREEPINTFARFIGWSGCGPLSNEYNCRIVMDGPKTVGAGWMAPEIFILPSLGNGSGKITGPRPMGDSFDCTVTASSATGVCSAHWETGPTMITLTATPAENSVFMGWVGPTPWCSGTGPCVLSPGFNVYQLRMEVRARFEVPGYVFRVFATGSGSGRVSWSPTQPDCLITGGVPDIHCGNGFARGTVVTLTADPTGGSTFGGWGGVCSGTQPTCALIVNAEAQATVRFNPPRPAAELALALLGRLTLTPEEQYQLDRFGNADGTFNLGDLLALIARTGERLSPSTLTTAVLRRR